MRYLSIWLLTALFQFTIASGCSKESTASPTAGTPGTTPVNLPKSFLALGDSYTIGESVSIQERFPAQTISLLQKNGISFSEPGYIARTGWTTADLQSAINSSTLQSSYDVVSLLIGVNDQYRGLDTAGYRVRFTQLLQKAIQLAGNQPSHVFVVSIPDYGVTPFGGGSAKISREIDEFNAINKQVTLANNIVYVDITPISKQAATDQSLTANDGLHPSGKQYGLWAMKVAEVVLPVVK